jgi:hypothetical protein
MNKQLLIDEIEAFAAARASGNPLLIQRQIVNLERLLAQLPDELPKVNANPEAQG